MGKETELHMCKRCNKNRAFKGKVCNACWRDIMDESYLDRSSAPYINEQTDRKQHVPPSLVPNTGYHYFLDAEGVMKSERMEEENAK